MFNLGDYLPKKPSEVEVGVIKKMFEASVDGEAYDMEQYGQYFRPAGVKAQTGDPVKASTPTPAPAAAPAPQAEAVAQTTSTEAPATAEAPATDNNKAEDILAMIRNRQG